jgi:DNA-binding MarR family transcriptional regulator
MNPTRFDMSLSTDHDAWKGGRMARSAIIPRTHTAAGAAFTELVLEIFRLNGRLLSSGDRLTRTLGLTSARWQVLGTLRAAPGPITVAQIARNMGLQRQSVQRTVDLLTAEGLVRMIDNPNHRRARLVVMTGAGRAVLRKASRLQTRWANDIADNTDAGEIRSACRVLQRLRQRLGDRRSLTD